ncbi:MAG TPA: hypothetical protein VN154_10855 [Rhizomicrobium sp.]|nr:hypothetical protein [Rhizomicrobium sp.]
MISEEDCFALCGLNEREVAAIAEHEHIPEVAAAALAHYLLSKDGGENVIRQMLVEDIQDALERNRHRHAHELSAVLANFLTRYPRAAEGHISR